MHREDDGFVNLREGREDVRQAVGVIGILGPMDRGQNGGMGDVGRFVRLSLL